MGGRGPFKVTVSRSPAEAGTSKGSRSIAARHASAVVAAASRSAPGRIAQKDNVGVLGNNVEVVYTLRMQGGRSPSGNTAGGVVQTPVIDDVTLTYFLPSPRILLQEEDL